MTFNSKIFRTGGSTMRSPVTTYWKKRFPGSLIMRVRQVWNATNIYYNGSLLDYECTQRQRILASLVLSSAALHWAASLPIWLTEQVVLGPPWTDLRWIWRLSSLQGTSRRHLTGPACRQLSGVIHCLMVLCEGQWLVPPVWTRLLLWKIVVRVFWFVCYSLCFLR